jgi:hypothetical protein
MKSPDTYLEELFRGVEVQTFFYRTERVFTWTLVPTLNMLRQNVILFDL